jgi:hypothetical protein
MFPVERRRRLEQKKCSIAELVFGRSKPCATLQGPEKDGKIEPSKYM